MPIVSKDLATEFLKKTYFPLLTILSVLAIFYSPLKSHTFPDYSTFHTIAEILSVCLGFMIFIFQWSIRSKKMNSHVNILACTFLSVAVFDLFHALSNKGMPDLFGPNSVDKAVYFWFCARIIQSLAFLVIAIRENKKITNVHFNFSILFSLGVVATLSWGIFNYIDSLPRMFIEGSGLTPTKINLEYSILFINICAAGLFFRRYLKGVATEQNLFLSNAALLVVSSEFCFTLYTKHNDMLNFWGHILKISCYVYIYRAILLRELLIPYEEIESIKKELEVDIENIKSLELELERSRKIASLGTEVGRIAHDLNNILMIVNTSAHYILKIEQNNENPRIVKKVDQIKSAVEKARVFLKCLINFSRNVQSERETVNLGMAFNEYQNLLGPLISKNIRMKFSCEANLSLCMIRSDLEQLILNLVINARDAMENNGGVITINAENKTLDQPIEFLHNKIPQGEYLCISVEDNGGGIKNENLSKIFNPFFTTKEEGKGTGIGLATVVSIMEKNQGHIQVETEIGAGTKFTLYFSKSCNFSCKEDSMAESA